MDNVIYKGFITLVKRAFRGKDWEVIKSKPAVAAIIFNEEGNKVLLVKQHRAALEKEIWEIPAGMMDVDGEAPWDCMARELQEEAEIVIEGGSLTNLIGYYPMPGCSDHYLDLYVGRAKQTYDFKYVNDADVTEARWFTFDEVALMMDSGTIVDGKTILACALTFPADSI